MDVTRVVGGTALFQAMAVSLILANLGAGLSAQVGVARLLFGMGRDNALPRKVFAYLDPKRSTPTYNIWIVGVLAFGGALLLSYERSAEVINFGAFLAYMSVNLAALRQFCFLGHSGQKRRWLADVMFPALGFLFCLMIMIWLNLPTPAKIIGGRSPSHFCLCRGCAPCFGRTRCRGAGLLRLERANLNLALALN